MTVGELISFNPAEQVRILENYESLAPAIRAKLVREPLRSKYIDIFEERGLGYKYAEKAQEVTSRDCEQGRSATKQVTRRPPKERKDAPKSPLKRRSLLKSTRESGEESKTVKTAKETLSPFLQRTKAKALADNGPKAATGGREFMMNPFNIVPSKNNRNS